MNYLKRIPDLFRKIKKNPKFFNELLHYAKNDFLSFLGVYSYPNRIIFIAGLPKSGTTWLHTELANVSGYNIRPIDDPEGVTLDHDICESVFSWLPKRGYSIIKLHTHYSPENFRIIKKFTPKFVVTIRDLRDMTISAYFHVKGEAGHRHHELYNKISVEDGLLHRIEEAGAIYAEWVRDWTRIATENLDTILLVKYEDLNADPMTTFKKVFDFYRLPMSENLQEKIIASKMKAPKDFKKEREKTVGLRTTSTARKGIIGDWKNYFTDVHKEAFKRVSGDILVETGYETGNNW